MSYLLITKINKNQLIKFIPFLIVFILAFKILTISPLANDSYLHIAIGRYIVEHKNIPIHHDISFKDVDQSLEWLTHAWAADLLIYLTSNYPLIFTAITFIMVLGLIYLILNTLNFCYNTKLVSVLLASVLLSGIWKFHPLVFLPIQILAILFLYLNFKKYKNYFIWLIPIVFLFTANLIGGYVSLVFLVLLFFLIIEVIAAILRKSTFQELFGIILVTVISFVITFLNPLGFKIWTYGQTAFSILTSPTKSSGSLISVLSTINQSFVRTNPFTAFYILFLVFFLITAIAFCFLSVKHGRNFLKKIIPFLPLALFFLLSLQWIRFIPLAVTTTIIIFAIEFEYIIQKLNKFRNIILFFLIFIFGTISLTLIFHTSEAKLRIPQAELREIKKLNLPDNLFTTYDLTPYTYYFNYPKKVFLDAQDDFFDENDLTDFYIPTNYMPAQIFNDISSKYEINTVLTDKFLGFLANELNKDSRWALVYFDTQGFVFVKKTSVSYIFLRDNSLNHIALTQNLGFNQEFVQEAQVELSSFIKKYPNNSIAIGQLATIYRTQNKLDEAENILNTIDNDKRDFTFYTEMGRIKAAKGDCKASENLFLIAIKEKSEQKFSRAVLDLAVVYAGCLGDKEKAKHYFQRYLSFVLSMEEKQKAQDLARQFGVSLDGY